MSFCIYKSSSYYQRAHDNPTTIIKPIGYDTLHAQQSETFNATHEASGKEILDLSDLTKFVIKVPNQKTFYRTLSHYRSQKLTAEILINQYLKVSELQRKNQYLSGGVLQFISSLQKQQKFIADLEQRFFPLAPASTITSYQKSLIQISQLLYSPYFEGIYQVGDYAISKYFMLFQNTHTEIINFLCDAVNRKLLTYQIQANRIIHENLKQTNQQNCEFPYGEHAGPKNFASLSQILQLIQSIHNQNKKKDPFYSGINFYFSDYTQTAKKAKPASILRKQIRHLPVFQYQLLMITGLLAHNQSAIIKIQGSFQHKTVEFLYILNLIFDGKITLSKPLGSNIFTPCTYVLCEHFNKYIGKIIHRYLIVNFGILYGEDGNGIAHLQQFIRKQTQSMQLEQPVWNPNTFPLFNKLNNIIKGQEHLYIKEERLLIDTKKLIKDDFQSISQFNDLLIYKGLQSNFKQQKKQANSLFYPNKSHIIEKLKDRHCKDLSYIIQEIQEPTQQKKQKEEEKKNVEKITKKQADFSILTMLTQPKVQKHNKNHKQQSKDKKNEKKKEEVNEGKQKKSAFESFLEKAQQKNEEEKMMKSKSKQKKKQKNL